MSERPIHRIAIIGTGVIGASWTALFLAKGLEVVATDVAPDAEAMLKRVPRGFPPDHPAADWLRFQSFTAGRKLADADVLGPALPDRLAKDYAALVPFVRWLNRALGLAAADRR
mgnify:CR=1 FL=1